MESFKVLPDIHGNLPSAAPTARVLTVDECALLRDVLTNDYPSTPESQRAMLLSLLATIDSLRAQLAEKERECEEQEAELERRQAKIMSIRTALDQAREVNARLMANHESLKEAFGIMFSERDAARAELEEARKGPTLEVLESVAYAFEQAAIKQVATGWQSSERLSKVALRILTEKLTPNSREE